MTNDQCQFNEQCKLIFVLKIVGYSVNTLNTLTLRHCFRIVQYYFQKSLSCKKSYVSFCTTYLVRVIQFQRMFGEHSNFHAENVYQYEILSVKQRFWNLICILTAQTFSINLYWAKFSKFALATGGNSSSFSFTVTGTSLTRSSNRLPKGQISSKFPYVKESIKELRGIPMLVWREECAG